MPNVLFGKGVKSNLNSYW